MHNAKTESEACASCRDLTGCEMDQVGGGMKWERGTSNPDVIDARGGQFNFGPFVITLDAGGNPSSISWR